MMSFFFFQAEDGIRDYKVTGVQTCALPICMRTCIKNLFFVPVLKVGLSFMPAHLLIAQTFTNLHSFTGVSDGANPYADRKSTRLNSSHLVISYAVFCLKKKKKQTDRQLCCT